MIREFFTSTGAIALAEMGDKTQLLAFTLAVRFKKPIPIIAGIFTATVFNHILAGMAGNLLGQYLGPEILKWILSLGFILMGIWILIPDKIDESTAVSTRSGVFLTTATVFFLAEMGDKTQLATVAFAANADSLVPIIMGTTLGMMIADVPAVFFGNGFAQKIPIRVIHGIASAIFIAIGVIAFFKI